MARNDFSWSLSVCADQGGSLAHASKPGAHYSKNWTAEKQKEYNHWYYINKIKKDAGKALESAASSATAFGAGFQAGIGDYSGAAGTAFSNAGRLIKNGGKSVDAAKAGYKTGKAVKSTADVISEIVSDIGDEIVSEIRKK